MAGCSRAPQPASDGENAGVPAACTKEYAPVCGSREVQCIRAPCPPVRQTYGNRCVAEADGALNIEEGACPEGPEEPAQSEDGGVYRYYANEELYVEVPEHWAIVAESPYVDPVAEGGCDWEIHPRGCEYAYVVFGTDSYDLDCGPAGSLEECLSQYPSGAYFSVDASYRPEETVHEAVESDRATFSMSTFTQSPVRIAGRDAYLWDLSCDICPYSSVVVFNAAPHRTYTVEARVFVNPGEDPPPAEEQLQRWQRELEGVLAGFTFDN